MVKKLIEVNKLKASTRNEFDTDGDTLFLTIKVNKVLSELLKKACVLNLDSLEDSFYTGEDDIGNRQYFEFKRFKAKTIFFKELQNNNSTKNILYSVDLLNNGVVKIPFYSVYSQTEFLNSFQSTLKILIELLIGENIEREITFNLSETIAE